MAKTASRPGRTLIIFGLVLAALYGGVALGGNWAPRLGLDLQGGTRITLEASTATGEEITQEKLEEAASIIDSRVNATGVTEAEVAIQGENNIIVEIPGQNATALVDDVRQTAELRFRLVAAGPVPGRPQPQPSASPSGQPSGQPGGDPSAQPSGPAASPGAGESAAPDGETAGPGADDAQSAPADEASPTATPRGRALAGAPLAADAAPSPSPSPSPSPAPTGTPAPAEQPPPAPAGGAPVDQPLQWFQNPGQEWVQRFVQFQCPPPGETVQVDDVAGQPLITCDDQGFKYLLSAAVIEGTQLTDANAGIPQGSAQWIVSLDFDNTASETFADVTGAIAGTQQRFAIVLDGQVLSAPTASQRIPGGNAQIEGDFTQEEAQTLANSLKYGALPLTFTAPVVSNEGPSLAGDQLAAGVTAGIIGLAIVLVYCMFYYRGLGVVVIASLAMAAAMTYALVLAMSAAVGFTLTLPGIAGLIVGIGITADSFIVYFERIRDEMRDGKSMRVAVEAGWVRARTTCLAADAVSLLAAVVLYIFAIGVVKGFAFALGLSTLIDIAVFFLFTKPMVSWLAKFPFFNQGHKMSGLDAGALGVDHLPGVRRPRAAGGEA